MIVVCCCCTSFSCGFQVSPEVLITEEGNPTAVVTNCGTLAKTVKGASVIENVLCQYLGHIRQTWLR